MAEMKRFRMRYKAGRIGVTTGEVEARSLERAEELGRQYCLERPGFTYLGMEDPILVREVVQVEPSPESPISAPYRKTA